MKPEWTACKNLLCVRTDNMGDILMSVPAIRALKHVLDCRITLLASKQGAPIVPSLKEIDEVIVHDIPWMKLTTSPNRASACQLITELEKRQFDAAIIFTVYSQSALPAALCVYMAGIPLRLAYARENPYGLLTDWYPDTEPFDEVVHQVTRDIRLVEKIGVEVSDDQLSISTKYTRGDIHCLDVLAAIPVESGYLVVHPGVSESRRQYPVRLWRQTLRQLSRQVNIPILITGSTSETTLATDICHGIPGCYDVSGRLSIDEWISLIAHAELLISVNTAAVHIAAAADTAVIVLYALTNPQHSPWKVSSVTLPFSVPYQELSKSPVIQYIARKYFPYPVPYPAPAEIVRHTKILLRAACSSAGQTLAADDGSSPSPGFFRNSERI